MTCFISNFFKFMHAAGDGDESHVCSGTGGTGLHDAAVVWGMAHWSVVF